nr:retrotransposon protein, putative, Ty1-copia subclass [Tanacetum cinerariifolium]
MGRIEQVDLTEDVPGATQEDLLGASSEKESRRRAFEAQAEKDRTLMRLEELRFLATSTKDLDDEAYWIKKEKRLIKKKMRNDLGDEDDEDDSGDLYPVTSPSPTPYALLSVSSSTWHQRLGHPGEDVLCSLLSPQIVLSIKDKLNYLEQLIPPAPVAPAGQYVAPEILAAHNAWIKGSKEMLMTMEPEIQRNLKPLHAHEMLRELKTLFAQQAEQELLHTTRDFHSCRLEEGQSVSSYVLKMKGYIDNLERLGHHVTLGLGVSMILIGLRKEYDGFVQNYNTHSMGKTVNELHAMLKLYEQTLPKNNVHALHAIRAGKVQKGNKYKKSQSQTAAMGQKHGKGKNKTLEEELSSIFGRVAEEEKGCSFRSLWLRASRKLKPRALSLYVGNGQHEAVEAIGVFYLCLLSGLEIVLNNCHYAPSITRGVISVSRLYEYGFINCFVNNTIQVSRNNVVYFSAIPRDDIFEIDLSNSYKNESSIYVVSNKRAKLDLDSSLLWHCRLGHISKKSIDKLQHDGLLDSSDSRDFEKCISCMSGKMKRKPYTHQVERAKDLLGLIHTDHKHEVFESFKMLQKEVENQLGKTIKSLRSDREGEYMSQEFLDHLKDHGIIAHRTPPYTPQHNGMSERSTRTRHVPDHMCLYIDVKEHELGDLGEPVNYKAALLDPESEKWLNAMNVEMQSMKDNEVWVLVELHPNGKTIGSKWLFKKKTDMDGGVHTYKARLVAKGYTQTPKIDFEETFSPVADIRAIRILIAIAAYYDYEIWQMDVKTTFLNGYLNKEVYMEQLKGEAEYILGITIYIDRSRRLIFLCQSAYIEKILKQYCVENSKRRSIPMQEKLKLSKSQGASTPAELKRMKNVPYASTVGSIMYDVRCTRPDVAFAQNVKSRFQQNPGDLHWTTFKNILKYLRNTKDMFLTGYVFILNGGAVDWKSAKQSIFATSSAEAEYIVAFDASKEVVWVRKFISGLGVVLTIEETISMYCDNTGAIDIANESGITKGVRHFRAKVHYIREVIEYGDIKLEKVHTDDNLADPFTKALAFSKHSEHTRNIEMLPSSSLM